MRIANLKDRLTLLTEGGAIDVEQESGGRFGADPQAVFAQWRAFRAWVSEADLDDAQAARIDGDSPGPPSPRPRQVFAIGLNYREHAAEGGYTGPTVPSVFTKFPTCLAGQNASVRVASPRVDWEIELVALVGEPAYRVSRDQAWSHVAGLTVGQDISARDVQYTGTSPQFSLAKSFPGFGPTGPWLITPDEIADPDDLHLLCTLNGETVQEAHTAEMILSVPELIAHISSTCPMLPGDLVFTGTPAGVGHRRNPPRYLGPGDELVSTIEGIGSLRTRFVTAD